MQRFTSLAPQPTPWAYVVTTTSMYASRFLSLRENRWVHQCSHPNVFFRTSTAAGSNLVWKHDHNKFTSFLKTCWQLPLINMYSLSMSLSKNSWDMVQCTCLHLSLLHSTLLEFLQSLWGSIVSVTEYWSLFSEVSLVTEYFGDPGDDCKSCAGLETALSWEDWGDDVWSKNDQHSVPAKCSCAGGQICCSRISHQGKRMVRDRSQGFISMMTVYTINCLVPSQGKPISLDGPEGVHFASFNLSFCASLWRKPRTATRPDVCKLAGF